MKFIKQLQQKISLTISAWLMRDIEPLPAISLTNFDHVCYYIKPCDVLLVDGRSRVSYVIKMITQSKWSHSAIYIGRIAEINDEALKEKLRKYYSGSEQDQLLIESQMGKGVMVTSLEKYRREDLRICRPSGLDRKDANAVVAYCIRYLGLKYDVRQILDLARFLFPWGIMPREWRTSVFEHNAGDPTHASCSRLLAEAFHSVRYPILPDVILSDTDQFEVVARNTRLYTPSDFDSSPFFEILKFPIFDLSDISAYRHIHWRDDLISDDKRGLSKVEIPTATQTITVEK